MPRVLVVASWHDVPTTIAAYSAVQAAQKISGKGLPVTLLVGMSATRLPLWLTLLQPYDMIIYSGHGTKNSWVGNDPVFRLIREDNADWLQGRIAVGVPVCLSASILGKLAVRKGAVSFFGSKDLMWAAFPEHEHNYMQDFIDCWQTIPLSLADGATTGEALREYREKCTSYIDTYRSMEGKWSLADWYADALEKNRDYYTLLGRTDATLEETEKIRKNSPNPLQAAAALAAVGLLSAASITATLTLLKEKLKTL